MTPPCGHGIQVEALGHHVRVAYDGPSAIAIVEELGPEVVFLDIGLPGMSGYELVGRLRTMLASPDVRFIALSGYGQPKDRERALDAGFDAHLVKPADLGTLQRTIEDTRRAKA